MENATGETGFGQPLIEDPSTWRDGGADLPGEVREAGKDPSNQFDCFVKVERLGEGGSASVWKCFDMNRRRWVTVKFLSHPADEADRVLAEARGSAGLRHPSIVPVLETGVFWGQAYIVMEYVRGNELSLVPLTIRERVDAIRQAALAVDYAHRHGVVHRDLKPANLMMDGANHVWILNFGVAGATGAAANGAVGTTGFMSPEQASGKRIGPSSDIYSLGATLYMLLCGRPPAQGATNLEILEQILFEAPPAPRSLNPKIPRDLEAVILKALEKEPALRYPTAAALALDLGLWLAGEPVFARPPGLLRRWTTKLLRTRRQGAGVP